MGSLKHFYENLKLGLDNFFALTLLHGVKYLQSDRSKQSKIFWRFVTYTSAIISLYIIYQFYLQYRRNAIITTIELTPQGLALKFPSIFICPDDIWKQEEIKALAEDLKTFHGLKSETEHLIECIKIYTSIHHLNYFNIENCQEFIAAIHNGIVQMNLTELFLSSKNIIGDCTYKGNSLDCKKRFVPFFTELGLCFAFSSQHRLNDLEKDIFTSESKYLHLKEYEESWDLHLSVRIPETTTRFYLKDGYGMLTVLDLPNLVWKNDSTHTTLKFEISANRAWKHLRRLSKEQRSCIFKNEFSSYTSFKNPTNKYFYSQDICRLTCHEAELSKYCKCLYKGSEIFKNIAMLNCSFEELNCIRNYFPKLLKMKCDDCLMDCNYNLIKSYTEPWLGNIKELGTDPNFREITIGLAHWPVYRYRKTVIYDIFDLLVSFAGVGGFFLGFSFIAVNEIIYFLAMPFFNSFLIKKKIIKKEKDKVFFIKPINLSLVPCKKFEI